MTDEALARAMQVVDAPQQKLDGKPPSHAVRELSPQVFESRAARRALSAASTGVIEAATVERSRKLREATASWPAIEKAEDL